MQSDSEKTGITAQRRSVPALSDNSVIRNYHYIINAYINSEGGVETLIEVEPWKKKTHIRIYFREMSRL